MKFTPLNEEQLAELNLLPEGVYDFEVIEAKNRVSKSGNDMIELKLKVYDQSGGFRFVTDYLLEAFLPKLYAFAKATGTLKAYETGEYDAYNCLNTTGKLQLKIKPAGDFPARNEVKMYGEAARKSEGSEAGGITPAAPTQPMTWTYKPSAPAPDFAEDDIPF